MARIGCALCDPTETLVRPISVVEPPDAEAVASLVVAEEVDRVVVGLPRTLAGREAEQAGHAREFSEKLSELVPVPVEVFDERLTTRMAQASRRAGASAAEDSLAAAHLLESYLVSAARRKAGDDG